MLFFQGLSILLLLWDRPAQSLARKASLSISLWFGAAAETLLSADLLEFSLRPGSSTAKSLFTLWPFPSARQESGGDPPLLSGTLIKMYF